jgi:hypothetical protein
MRMAPCAGRSIPGPEAHPPVRQTVAGPSVARSPSAADFADATARVAEAMTTRGGVSRRGTAALSRG